VKKRLLDRDNERRAFTQGYIEAFVAYAVWTNEKQKVGIMKHDLGAVTAKILAGEDQYFETGWSLYRSIYPEQGEKP